MFEKGDVVTYIGDLLASIKAQNIMHHWVEPRAKNGMFIIENIYILDDTENIKEGCEVYKIYVRFEIYGCHHEDMFWDFELEKVE